MYLVHFKSDYLRQQQLCAALAFVVLPLLSSKGVVNGGWMIWVGSLVGGDDSQVPHMFGTCMSV